MACSAHALPMTGAPIKPLLRAYVLPEVSGDISGITWAANKHEAWLNIAYEHISLDDDCPNQHPNAHMPCEIEDCECSEFPSVDLIYREKAFDSYTNTDEIKPSAWQRAGFGGRCVNCESQDAYQHDEFTDVSDYCVIDERVICHECMTYGDWMQVCPERAAEMLDEMLYDEYGI